MPRFPERPPLRDYAAFSDESCTNRHRFMVIGGVSLSTAYLDWISSEIDEIRTKKPFKDSLQWKRVTSRKIDKYIELLDLFIELNSEHIIDFHALTFDTWKVSHRTHSDGDAETGFYKFVFQSMFSHTRRYSPALQLRCVHGSRDTTYSLTTLTSALNNTVLAQISTGHRPHLPVEHARVNKTPLLQLADVLIGAVGHAWNGKMEQKPDHPHTILARYLEANGPATTLSQETPRSMPHFDIWRFRLKGLGG